MIESRNLGLGLAVGLAVCVGLTFYGALEPVPQKAAPKKHVAHYTAHVQAAVHHAKHRQEPLNVERLPPLKQIVFHEPNIAVLAILEPEYTAPDQKSGWYQMVGK